MALNVNENIANVTPSPTLALQAEVGRLKAEGRTIIGLAAGQPDFPTPQNICDAAIKALADGYTKYTPASGIPELRQAVADSLNANRGTSYPKEEVIITNGAKQALFLTMEVALNPGDEVIIPAPYWVSFSSQVELVGGRPVLFPLRPEDGYKLDFERLKLQITPQTRAIILCSPSNPLGTVFGPDELHGVAELARKHDLMVVADETYDRLVYEPAKFLSILDVAPDLVDRTILIGSLSKTYSMTGWRVGWAAGPKAFVSQIGKIMSHSTSNVSSPAQYAGLEAITGPQDAVHEMKKAFDRRRNVAVQELQNIPNLGVVEPLGAFYIFPDLQAYIGKGGSEHTKDIDSFCMHLLREYGVAVVAGTGFGSNTCVRISYATSDDLLIEGIRKLGEALARLS